MGLGISKLVRGITRAVKGPKTQKLQPVDFNIKPKELKANIKSLENELKLLKKPTTPFAAFSKESLKKAAASEHKINIDAKDIFDTLV